MQPKVITDAKGRFAHRKRIERCGHVPSLLEQMTFVHG
ncbi:hypothetical protein FHT77_004173 [Rhizobium sp. BK181]|nr:hypothetical protein [Rhizobium sp. BK181]